MDRSEFRRGVRDVTPLLLGIVPFGFIAGIATVNAGLGLPEAVGLSAIVFAGAAQLAALELIGRDAPLAIVVVTAVVINLRMLMYSASIAPHLQALSSRTKAAVAYLLTDQAYALTIARYRTEDAPRRIAYYFGVAATLWVVWQLTTIAGVVLGTSVPESLGLEFAVPLVFLALLVPAMEDGPTTVAGVLGGIVAVGTAGLPLNLGLLVGAAVGILAGLLTETATEGSPSGD
ncbi:AzlC family ABC transporter permease [Haloarcula onubensis]|uniref:AzlC family ABC transporter permease n=1 Tax=Haloarcula onubensis TaxID=2950539 RepID=A0ABU2FRG2_9EURY|nr:AzlC family ABC transporter permease [Halomicroarcula sp. S3CR25-11]MDS0282832.1 AzlC family ABC transporter permease [Halomicroarcula sp. S3CR25-11]